MAKKPFFSAYPTRVNCKIRIETGIKLAISNGKLMNFKS